MYTMVGMLMDGHGMTAQVIHALPECLIGRGPCKYGYPHQKELLFPDNKCDLIVACILRRPTAAGAVTNGS